MECNYKRPFNTRIQVGNNRNAHFRYFLGVYVRLIKVSFKVNKGNKFGDFGDCPLNTVSA